MPVKVVCALLLLAACTRAAATLSADFVFAGAGSTGAVAAGRLAAAGYDVVMIEAGYPTQASLGGCSVPGLCPFLGNLTIFDVPMTWLEILTNPRYKEQFEWVTTGALPNTSLPAIAKGVGGCGIHNAMIYMRGTPDDFRPDSPWGLMGWDWDSVLPMYKASENNSDYPAGEYHRVDGPVQISQVSKLSEAASSRDFLEACLSGGLELNSDFNGPLREGVGNYQFLVRAGVRASSAAAYIAERRAGPGGSLQVLPRALASRVLFDSNRTAVGVEYLSLEDNATHTVSARRQVIISSGAINTPKLLMLSGVGPASALDRHNIPVVADVEGVGRNLVDGVFAIMQWDAPKYEGLFKRCTPNNTALASEDQSSPGFPIKEICDVAATQYETLPRSGLYTSPGLNTGAFLRSPYSSPIESPDVQMTFHPWDKFLRNWSEPVPRSVVSMEISFNHAKSRGEVTVASPDPLDPPVVDSPYLKVESDVLPLVWAMRRAREIMKSMNTTELVPGEAVQSDQELIHYIRCGDPRFRPEGVDCDTSYLAVQHLGGTARMGPADNASSVVDEQLRVRGVNRLRVADASIMPNLPSGNSHATCMMIGERAASFLLDEFGVNKEIKSR